MISILWSIFEIIIDLYQSIMVIYYPYKLLGVKNKSNEKVYFLSVVFIHFLILMLQDHIVIADNWFTILYFTVNFIYSFTALNGNCVKKVIGSIMPLILLSVVGIFTLDFFSTVSDIPVIELVQNRSILRLMLILTVQILIYIVFKISLDLLRAANDSYLLKDWIKVVVIAVLSLSMGALLHHLLIYEAEGNIRFIVSILLGLLFITDMFFFSMTTHLINQNRQIKEMELIKIQQNYQKKIINEITSQYDSIRKIRHDVKDTYQTVYSLIDSNKTDEAKKLISGNYDLINRTGIYVKTNNNILNAVVNAKLTAASTSGIKVSCITTTDINGIRIAEIKQQLSINELRIVQEYLFIFGTFTCDQDMRDAYQNVVSLFENNNLELFSVNDYNINSNNSSYSSSKAVAYAHKYYENYNPNYEDFTLSGGDCCNFVSQCLKAGGFSTTDNWYYNTKNDYSSSWINCSYLLPYLKNNAYNYDYYSASYYRKYSRNITKAMKINAGDVVIVCTYAGIFDLPWHALFVTSVNNYEVRCASHTDDYYSKAIVTNTGISDDDYLYFIDIKKDPYTYK